MRRSIYFVLGVFMLVSCIDDQSDSGGKPVSVLSFETQLEDAYQRDKFSEFVLEAPKVIQKNQDKELSYEWQVNYEVKSRTKELKYECLKSGDFPCRLKISNEDGAIFKEFTLNVPFPYEDGLLILSKFDGHSMLSFKDLQKLEQEALKDVYVQNNPHVSIGKRPVDMAYVHTPSGGLGYNFLYIATEDPLRVVTLDYNTLEVLSVVKFPEPKVERVMKRDGTNMTFIGNGKIMEMSCGGEDFLNNFQQTITGTNGVFPDAYLSDQCFVFWGDYSFDSYIVFDTRGGILIKSGKYGASPSQVYDTITGAKLLGAQVCRNKQEGLAMVKNKEGKNYIAYMNISSLDKLKSYWPAPAELTENSVFMTSGTEDVLYYSIGNHIYRYNYTSDGNFPTKADYTVGATGDVIKDMVLDPKEEKLYVAVNSPDGEYKGSIYCYDNVTKGFLWKENKVAGEIVRMVYKVK